MTKSLIRTPRRSSFIIITPAVTAPLYNTQAKSLLKIVAGCAKYPLDRHIKYGIYPHWIARKNGTSWKKQLFFFCEGLSNWITLFYLLTHWMNQMLQSRELCHTEMMNNNSYISWNTDRCITVHCFIQKTEG